MSALFASTKTSIPKVNLSQELQQTLTGLAKTAPGFLTLNQMFAGPYTDLNLSTLERTLFGTPTQTGELPIESAAATFQRASDVADVAALGPAGYQALLASNPGLAATLGAADVQGASMFAPGSLLGTLTGTAQSELALGGMPSAQELTLADQASRAGAAQRGLFNQPRSLASEILNRDQFYNQRLGQRLGWAGQVAGLQQSGIQGLGQLASINAGVFNPYQDVLGRSPLLGSNVSPLGLMGTANTASLFSPTMGQDIFSTNFNAQSAQRIANANTAAGVQAGALTGLGAVLGGAISYSDKRLKRRFKKLGETPEGIPFGSFEYKGIPGRTFVGATAQDIEKVHPEAVVTLPLTGIKMVDTWAAGTPFYELKTLTPTKYLKKAA